MDVSAGCLGKMPDQMVKFKQGEYMVMRFPKQNDDVHVTDIVESYDHYEVPSV